jgi:hypothetical protein
MASIETRIEKKNRTREVIADWKPKGKLAELFRTAAELDVNATTPRPNIVTEEIHRPRLYTRKSSLTTT